MVRIVMQRRGFLYSLMGAIFPGRARAADGSWHSLGSLRVGVFVDHDTIDAGPWKTFRKLKLSITGSSLHVSDLKVTYHNGSFDHIPVRWLAPEGGGERVVDLGGADGVVRRVDLIYGSMPNGRGNTHVRVYGQA